MCGVAGGQHDQQVVRCDSRPQGARGLGGDHARLARRAGDLEQTHAAVGRHRAVGSARGEQAAFERDQRRTLDVADRWRARSARRRAPRGARTSQWQRRTHRVRARTEARPSQTLARRSPRRGCTAPSGAPRSRTRAAVDDPHADSWPAIRRPASATRADRSSVPRSIPSLAQAATRPGDGARPRRRTDRRELALEQLRARRRPRRTRRRGARARRRSPGCGPTRRARAAPRARRAVRRYSARTGAGSAGRAPPVRAEDRARRGPRRSSPIRRAAHRRAR